MRLKILIFFLAFSSTLVSAKSFRFKHLGIDKGLSESSALCLMQDSYGYIWAGTKDGLNRFDGIHFKVFRTISNDSTSLGNDFVRAIYELDKEHILVGSENGIYVYNRKDDAFKPIKNNPEGVEVTDIDMYNDSTLVFTTRTDGIFIYGLQSATLTQLDNSNSLLADNTVWCLQKYNGKMLVGTRKGLIEVLLDDQNKPHINTKVCPNIDPVEVLSLHVDANNGLWIGTWAQGFMHIKDLNSQPDLHKGTKQDKDGYITHVRCFMGYNGNMLIGSDDGLYQWTGMELKRMDKLDEKENLTDKNIYSMIVDRDNGLWVGTYFGGINYLSRRLLGIDSYYPQSQTNSISGRAVSEIIEIGKTNKFWVATEDAGISLFNESEQSFEAPRFANELSYHNVHSLLEKDNELWIGTFSRGIDRVKMLGHNRVTNYRNTPDKHILNDNCIFSMSSLSDTIILMGTPYGLMYYNTNTDVFTPEKKLPYFIYDIATVGNVAWVATYGNGLFELNLDNYSVQKYSDSINSHMISSKLTSVFVDSRGAVWLGSEEGLCYLDQGEFTDLSYILPNNFIYSIVEDDFGYLWVSHNMGISRIDVSTKEVFNLNQNDGLQGRQFNYRSALKASNGKLLFGGVHGLNVIDPQQVFPNKKAPEVIVSRFSASNANQTDKQVWNDIQDSLSVDLPYTQSTIRFDFAAFSYLAPENNRYSYRLINLSDGQCWEKTTSEMTALFYGLSPGNYEFSVKGSNGDDVWSKNQVLVEFQILPPLWKSPIFMLLYGLIVLFGMLLVAYAYKKYINKKHQQEAEMFKVLKEQELFNSKMEFYTNLAHEIRTPITLVKGPLGQLEKSCTDEERKEVFKVVNRNVDRLTGLVEQLLTFRRVDEDKYPIVFSAVDIVYQVGEVIHQFENQIVTKGIRLETDFQAEEMLTETDQEAFTKILSNLISNAVKFTTDKLCIKVEKKAELIEITVTDNGAGIDTLNLENIFNPFFQATKANAANGLGLGLAIVKLLADKLKAHISVTSTLEKGTSLCLSIPFVDPIKQSADTDKTEQAGAKTILIVDDNGDIAKYVSSLLQEEYYVEVEVDSRNVMKRLNEKHIDLLICDMMMPNVDGRSLVIDIKSKTSLSSMPIIALSAKCNSEFEVEILKLGVSHFVKKPFDAEVLKAIVQNTINKTGDNDELKDDVFAEFKAAVNLQIEQNIIDITPDMLADLMCVSRSTLSRRINESFGMSPNEYIRFFKITKAMEMIKTQRYKINEICYLLGFNSPSYFSKCFKKITGVLPKEYNNTNL